MDTIKWTVTNEQAQYILKVLSQRPYSEVHGMIQALLSQANSDGPRAVESPNEDEKPKQAEGES